MIDKNSPIPIYYQLEEYIRTMIEQQKFRKNEALPSEREFAEQFGISRMTVRQALSNLVQEGLLVRQKGRGTFVAEKKIEQPLLHVTSFSEDMRRRGLVPSTRILDFQQTLAPTKVSRELETGADERVYEIHRLRLADEEPMAYEIVYLPSGLFPHLNEEKLSGSLYEYVEKEMGLRIERARETLEPGLAQLEESKRLQIPEHSPVLILRRTSMLTNNKPFEHVKSIYRGDRYKFITEMKRT